MIAAEHTDNELLSQSNQFGGGFFDDKKIRVSDGGGRPDDDDTAGPRQRLGLMTLVMTQAEPPPTR